MDWVAGWLDWASAMDGDSAAAVIVMVAAGDIVIIWNLLNNATVWLSYALIW